MAMKPLLLFCSNKGWRNSQLLFTSWRTFRTTPGIWNLEGRSESKRGFLREAYHCNAEWNKRFEQPLLKNISSLDDFFYDIDKRYQADKVISAIDVDLYANKVEDEEHLDELEELVHRLRRSPATADTLPSTHYAFVKTLFKLGRHDDLLRILNDRWNYGVFLDFHLANILMDEFLKRGNNRDAAKVANLLMLEEDFGSPTSQYLALVSCLTYLQDPKPDPWETNPPAKDPEEDVKIRLRYIRNPYFDDHFDLTSSNHLIGKTLALLGTTLSGDVGYNKSVEVLGLALYGKWNQVELLLNDCINKKIAIFEDVVTKVSELCDGAATEIESQKTLAKPKVHQYPGVNLDDKSVNLMWKQLNWPQQEEYVPKVKAILSEKKFSIQKSSGILEKAKELLSAALSEREDEEIQEQIKSFAKWNETRVVELDNQMKRFRKYEVMESVDARKKELQEKEDVIFFFDNEEDWMMRLPLDEQKGYKLSTDYVPRNYERFVRCVPPKKNVKKKKKE